MVLRSPSRTGAATILSIVGMIACIVFVSIRISESDRLLRKIESHVWLTTQAQYDCLRVAEALARLAAGDVIESEEQRPDYRMGILLSRFEMFKEGPQRRLFERLDTLDVIQRLHARLQTLEPRLAQDLSREEALALRAEVSSYAAELRDISNLLVRYDRDQIASTTKMQANLVLESFVTILAVLVGLTVLSFNLLRGMQEKTRAERLLRQEQEFSDLVINLSNQGILIADDEFKCLLWNPGMEALLGIRAGEVASRSLVPIVPLFGRAAVQEAMIRAIRGIGSTMEEIGLSASLQERCLEISCHPLRMAGRDLAIAFVRDVTERWQQRKYAEQQNVNLEIKVQQRTAALRQAESRLIAAINTAPDGFAAFDSNGRLLMANERIRAAIVAVDGAGDDLSLASFLAPFASCEGADGRLVKAGAEPEPLELDLQLSSEIWAHLSVTRADRGTVFVRLTDITHYKKAAMALQSALDREREMTSAYRSFVSMVSHQFRTPLAIIDSSAQRLIRRGLQISEEEHAARITKIRNAITRLTRLVEGVLNAARLEAGQIAFNPARYDLAGLVSDVCERQRELSPHVEICLSAPDDPVEIVCDGILIEQVVGNLLSNAVKYSDSVATVEVRITVEDGAVQCSVRDWGIGIPADEVSRIFDRFYRARTATGIAGTGIGLNVARHIMQMHGGKIHVDSRVGEGSTFTIFMPATSAALAPRAA